MEIRDFLRLFIENEQSAINSLNSDVIDWMLTVQLLDNFGNTPLHNLAQNGNLEAIKNLFSTSKKAIKNIYKHYNVQNMHGMNPMHAAILANQLPVVRFFCETDAEKTFIKPLGDWSLLDLSIISNNVSLASILIESANCDLKKLQLLNLPPLLAAALMDAYDIARLLVEKGVDLTQKDSHYASNVLLLSLHGAINTDWLTYLLQHTNLLYQRNKNGLAAADAYFQPTLFYVGWANGGQTHRTLRKLLRQHSNIIRLLLHHLISILIQRLQQTNQYWRDMATDLRQKLSWHKHKPPAYTSLPPKFSYAQQSDVLRKLYAQKKQLTKLYLSSSLALADNTSTDKGNMIYGVMTQRILESRGMMPVTNNEPATDNDVKSLAQEPHEITYDEMNAGIPEDLLPTAYKKDTSQNNS